MRATFSLLWRRWFYIKLLTMVTPRGVTDLYLSWWINIEHARTAYRKTCGTTISNNNHIVDNSQTPYFNWNIAQARPMSVSNVSRNLKSWVWTTHRSYSQLTSKFFWKTLKNVSCEYDRLNGWNSTLQAAWYIRHVCWVCLLYTWYLIYSTSKYSFCEPNLPYGY